MLILCRMGAIRGLRMIRLDCGSIAAIGKYVTVFDYPAGRLAIRCNGLELPYRTFDKVRQVDLGAIADNKHLGAVLAMIRDEQLRRGPERRSAKHPAGACQHHELYVQRCRPRWERRVLMRSNGEVPAPQGKVATAFGVQGGRSLAEFRCHRARRAPEFPNLGNVGSQMDVETCPDHRN